jgi:hypothetical protein
VLARPSAREKRLELLADDAVQERLHRIVRLVSALGILRLRHRAGERCDARAVLWCADE